ncbi:hypothetical protein CUN44_12655 [Enterococcus faecium]|uniref:hypothetical protein n=1 Tax=Enterococcus faecium TaxID=1352 RepID=UPI000CF1D262|nr:hypothetical protein [Enterococcus faecium]PQC69761.1 hypothetical protein CUN44_12655 [Enterococcus faecium]
MKFFEVKSPYYYALIAAKNEEECAELYEQVVTDIENREEFIRCLHELNRNEAIQEYCARWLTLDRQERRESPGRRHGPNVTFEGCGVY